MTSKSVEQEVKNTPAANASKDCFKENIVCEGIKKESH
jgi:hypothetical protein